MSKSAITGDNSGSPATLADYSVMFEDTAVYSRQAVRYQGDQWLTRPKPIDPTDQPHVGGRGKYTRQDGSIYQFDSNGRAFEVINGQVYQSTEEVKACYV